MEVVKIDQQSQTKMSRMQATQISMNSQQNPRIISGKSDRQGYAKKKTIPHRRTITISGQLVENPVNYGSRRNMMAETQTMTPHVTFSNKSTQSIRIKKGEQRPINILTDGIGNSQTLPTQKA